MNEYEYEYENEIKDEQLDQIAGGRYLEDLLEKRPWLKRPTLADDAVALSDDDLEAVTGGVISADDLEWLNDVVKNYLDKGIDFDCTVQEMLMYMMPQSAADRDQVIAIVKSYYGK